MSRSLDWLELHPSRLQLMGFTQRLREALLPQSNLFWELWRQPLAREANWQWILLCGLTGTPTRGGTYKDAKLTMNIIISALIWWPRRQLNLWIPLQLGEALPEVWSIPVQFFLTSNQKLDSSTKLKSSQQTYRKDNITEYAHDASLYHLNRTMYTGKNVLTRYGSFAKKFCYGHIFGTESVLQ